MDKTRVPVRVVGPVAALHCTGHEVEPATCAYTITYSHECLIRAKLLTKRGSCTYVTWGKVAYTALAVLVGPSRTRFSTIRSAVFEQQLQSRAQANSRHNKIVSGKPYSMQRELSPLG